jgi:hypothetical protein
VMDREPTECGCGSVMTTSSEGHMGQIDGGSRRIQARQRSSSAGRPGLDAPGGCWIECRSWIGGDQGSFFFR